MTKRTRKNGEAMNWKERMKKGMKEKTWKEWKCLEKKQEEDWCERNLKKGAKRQDEALVIGTVGKKDEN
jgi:hypothetical protein